MDLTALARILDATTTVYRKGPEVVERDAAGVRVVEVFGCPPPEALPAAATRVDVHFVLVGVDMTAARVAEPDLRALLATYPAPDRLAGGPSYIEAGAVLGSQEAALRLFALGEALGLWTVITPARLGITGASADQMAGGGLVLMSGYTAVAPS